MHCKRVAYNAGWLEALHRPNVHLTADPITAVSPTGLITKSGTNYEFDVIVWATGFDVSATGVGLNHGVYGLDGKELRELWEDNEGAFAYLGVGHSLVPNYFTVLGPNAISMSWGYTLGNQVSFIGVLGMISEPLTPHRRCLSAQESLSKPVRAALTPRLPLFRFPVHTD